MRISFVLYGGFNLSGGERVIATYAQRLLERGHEVFVVTNVPSDPTFRAQVRSLVRGRGLLPKWMPEPHHFEGTKVPHHRIESSRAVTDADLPDADVVIATWWETAEWVSRLAPSKGVKVSFLQHYEAFDYTPRERVDAVWRLPFHKVTISQWLVDLAREFGDEDVSLVKNSVETRLFDAPVRTRNEAPVVGFLYAHVPWKGCELSLRVLERLRERFPDLRVRAFGSDRVEEGSLTLPEWVGVEYRPAQSRIAELYASCDVWLCGSKAEGFHLPPLEAMACRTPVVSTAVGGSIDIIEDGVNGYCVPLGDEDGLLRGLVDVLSCSEGEWRRMSDAAYATSRAYSWDDATDAFEKALRYAMSKSAARGS